jgi:thiol-disulfide isomerase/thioredoxin
MTMSFSLFTVKYLMTAGIIMSAVMVLNTLIPSQASCQEVSFYPLDSTQWEGVYFSVPEDRIFYNSLNAPKYRVVDFLNSGFSIPKGKKNNRITLFYQKSGEGKTASFKNIREGNTNGTILISAEELDLLSSLQMKNRANNQEIYEAIDRHLRKNYSYFLFSKLSKRKIEKAIEDESIFKTPYRIFENLDQFDAADRDFLDSIWVNTAHFRIEFLGSPGLDSLYISHAINSGVKQFNCSNYIGYFAQRQVFDTSMENRKDVALRLLRESIHEGGLTCARLRALWYSYFHISMFGLTILEDNPYLLSYESIMHELKNYPDDKFKRDFIEFLEQEVPNLQMTEVDLLNVIGDRVLLNNYFEKDVILIDFWATWCKPCLRSFPILDSIYGEYILEIEIISISVDHDFSRYSTWVKKNPQYTWPFLYAGISHDVLKQFGVRAYPTYFIYRVAQDEIFGPYHIIDEFLHHFNDRESSPSD